MEQYEIISDVDKKINEALERLKLMPQSDVRKQILKKKRFYNTVCWDKNQRPYFFKSILQKRVGRASLARELGFNLALKQIKLRDTKINLPKSHKFIDGQIKKDFVWILFQYIDGVPLGYFTKINNKFLNKNIAKKVIQNIIVIQKSSFKKEFLKNFKFDLNKQDSIFYLNKLKEYNRRKIIYNYISKDDFDKAYDIIYKNKKILDKNCNFLSHGDFSLANQVVYKNSVYTIDWESIHIDNAAFDIANLWLDLWKYPFERKQMLSIFMKKIEQKEDFEMVFRSVILKFSLSKINAWHTWLSNKKEFDQLYSKEYFPFKENPLLDAKKTIEANKITFSKALSGFKELIE